MQTSLADFIRDTPRGREADAILRRCVHCGFCLATCPTYQLLGDERDSPRGRIYLVKQVLEGVPPTHKTLSHLDRCLTCRACETTCPSGVAYARLADIGRGVVEERVKRRRLDAVRRRALARLLSCRALFRTLVALARVARALLPARFARKLPARLPQPGHWPAPRHARRMIALAGCVQPVLAPDINAAAARLLDRAGISLVQAPSAGCCGALRYHLNFQREGLADMRALVDAWWPLVESGAEAIVMSASGCGATVREYARLLAHDPRYARKAARIAAMTRDLAEVVEAEWERLAPLLASPGGRIAVHSPCTLQHGQKLPGLLERLLARAGYELAPVADAHLCCGSAGVYSLLEPRLAQQLKERKLRSLQAGAPSCIVTANLGCQNHLAGGAAVPVQHWVTALERRLRAP
ncbi:MAG: glycolate oxidase subunit GlcF [Burkholderiales bacterium]|nr:glycolate oxidase subunit GlcF [Burkholderiales bacterium]